ncbi:MAG: hypothetical protein FJ179_09490 [Gammaproteobacteria bacterium]|nr:hypothetical protein [Gammaproteobacteria bacterium]
MNSLKLEGAKYGIRTDTIAPLVRTKLAEDVFPDEILQEMDAESFVGIVADLVPPDCQANGVIVEIGAGHMRRVAIEPSKIVRLDAHDKAYIDAMSDALAQLMELQTLQLADGSAGVRTVLVSD